ncbi:hypothetical protein [Nocardia grenadensis]|uniref:hypothetical protein n=1 Tax=Nocardia grenadensis TaxID=931537 RepID=UPI000A47E5B9|nr:hypothetical protein [Nocardia grenadensis]
MTVVAGEETSAASVPPATKTRGLYDPAETAVGQSGLAAFIVSVAEVNSHVGSVTVITLQIENRTGQAWSGRNWTTPTVVYGDDGTPAQHVRSPSEGFGDGVQGTIPPGSRQTVKHAYKVSKAQLNPAVVTAGSVLWQGDFSKFHR